MRFCGLFAAVKKSHLWEFYVAKHQETMHNYIYFLSWISSEEACPVHIKFPRKHPVVKGPAPRWA